MAVKYLLYVTIYYIFVFIYIFICNKYHITNVSDVDGGLVEGYQGSTIACEGYLWAESPAMGRLRSRR